MKAITALLTDIEKLDAYLHRYMSRAISAQNALGMPGTRIFNRVLASVGKVRKEVAALEQQKASYVPLMEADKRIRDLTLDNDRLMAETAGSLPVWIKSISLNPCLRKPTARLNRNLIR